jgi:WD40 repeat protein/transcriptional regulator with XRE-family HTH domain
VGRTYRDQDYDFGQRILSVRSAIGLTQTGLAEYLGISRFAIGEWESGNKYPKPEHLKRLLELAVKQNVFPTGSEAEEVRALWKAARQKVLLDEDWLSLLLNTRSARQHDTASVFPEPEGTRVDWGDALAVPSFFGREWELNLLTTWVVEQHCQVVTLLGLGGIGKSALAVHFMRRVADQFQIVIWRSLRDLPTCDALLIDLLQTLAPQISELLPNDLESRMQLLMEQLRANRSLLVLDNMESVLEEGEISGRIRRGYEGFGRFLTYIASTEHQSTILLTTRLKPNELLPYEDPQGLVRTLRLVALDHAACEQLLAEREVTGTDAEHHRLIELYGGNPLALKIVAQTILDLFGGEIAPFLEQGGIIFGDVRELLHEQYQRITPLERQITFWLTIMREPVNFNQLQSLFNVPLPPAVALDTVNRLYRHSLIERGQTPGSFTLQSVVVEYMSEQLVREVCQEIQQGEPAILLQHGLEQAQVKDYVRQTQRRLLTNPLLQLLQAGGVTEIERRLLTLLDQLRELPVEAQGYGPSNLVTLLHALRGDLRGVDLSHLALRGLYLQGVDLRDSNLSEVSISNTVFNEAFDALIAIAVNNTNTYWAAACTRGEIRIWNAATLKLHRVWQAHADMVWALSFRPDGNALATGSWDGTVKLWDVDTGALLWSGRHGSFINSIAFSPDGEILASSGTDSAVRFWNFKSDRPITTLEHSDPVTFVIWNPAGDLLAIGDNKGNIRLWAEKTPRSFVSLSSLKGHNNWVDGMAFSPDGSTLASASWDGTVKLWSIPEGDLIETLTGHKDQVSRVSWSFDGRLLASSSRDHTIWLWDVERRSYRTLLQGLTDNPKGLAFVPDGRSLLSGSFDGMHVWDVFTGQSLRIIRGYAIALYDVSWHPDGTHLISGSIDATVTIYDLTYEAPIRELYGHKSVVISVGWSPDGRWLASSEWDNTIQLWDALSGESIRVISHPDDPHTFFYGLSWSPDGKRLAVGTNCRGVQIFEVNSPDQSWNENDFGTWIRPVAWSMDGRYVAGGGDDGAVYIWSADDGTLHQKLEGHQSMVMSLAWSADGTRIASGGNSAQGGELLVWEVKHWKHLETFTQQGEMVTAVAWGANSDVVISGSGDGTLRWWNLEDRELMWQYAAHQGAVQSLSRSSQGIKLASAGDDGSVLIWDLSTGEHLQTLRRDRPYERMDITGIRGLTDAQKETLRQLGAVEKELV